MRARPPRPPTTPPTIAPTSECLAMAVWLAPGCPVPDDWGDETPFMVTLGMLILRSQLNERCKHDDNLRKTQCGKDATNSGTGREVRTQFVLKKEERADLGELWPPGAMPFCEYTDGKIVCE